MGVRVGTKNFYLTLFLVLIGTFFLDISSYKN